MVLTNTKEYAKKKQVEFIPLEISIHLKQFCRCSKSAYPSLIDAITLCS